MDNNNNIVSAVVIILIIITFILILNSEFALNFPCYGVDEDFSVSAT